MNKEKSDRIRTKPSKFGWRIYDGSQKVQVTEVGVYVCPICKETSKLVQRQDRIRRYESTFGKDATVRLDCYTEGVIEKSYPDLTDWLFDYRIDKCVSNGAEIKAPAWIIGHLAIGTHHHNRHIVLLQNAVPAVTYTQENLIL